MIFAVIAVAAVFVVAGLILFLRAFMEDPASPQATILQERLGTFQMPATVHGTLEEAELSRPFGERVLTPMLERFGAIITARSKVGSLAHLQEQLVRAQKPWGLDAGAFRALQIGTCAFFGLFFYGISTVVGLGPPLGILLPIVGFVGGFIGPDFMLKRRIKERQDVLRRALPNHLDLLTICMEAGLSFDAALHKVTERYQDELAAEFTKVLVAVRLGETRPDAMTAMAQRVQVDEITSIARAISQSEPLGIGIAQVLRVASEDLRRIYRQRAEEMGMKAPLKMLFPMIGCIFPTLFIVLLGPATIEAFNLVSGNH